jgi:hypothetical protein
LKLALEGYQAIEADKNADPMLKRLGMIGSARTLETQNELKDAIAQYEKIAKEWPDTEDGKAAAKRAERLKSPDAIAFYQKFAAYKSKLGSTVLPPRGTNRIDLPAGHPPLDGPIMPAPSLEDGVRAGAVGGGELPSDPFQKSAAEKKAEADKGDPLPSVFPNDEKEKTPAKNPSPPK